jgi:5'-nucleotidase
MPDASPARRPCSATPLVALALAVAACAHGGAPSRSTSGTAGTCAVKVLGINDFHGQLSPARVVDGRPVGGAAALAGHLEAAMAGARDRTVLVEAGDLVGASPAASALLRDEPAIAFFNAFANEHCARLPATAGPPRGAARFDALFDPLCNLVGVPGNHEFEQGVTELLRQLGGGNHARGPFLEDPWRGAQFPVVAANVTGADGEPLFRPYVVKVIDGVSVAFVGAAQQDTPHLVAPSGIRGLSFGDEADAINAHVPELQARGIHAIVVVVHDGAAGQPAYEGPTRRDAPGPPAEMARLVSRLDADVDVVVAAHAHAFTNAILPNAGGRDVLVVQALSAGRAFADVDLVIDRASGDVVAKSARIVTAWSDGAAPDPAVARLVAAAEARVAPIAAEVVAAAAATIPTAPDGAGESALADLVAEAHRAAMPGADFAVTNAAGVRTDLPRSCRAPPCPITWNDCFGAQPFSNHLVAARLTGRQLRQALEQQWAGRTGASTLGIAGFTYAWSAGAPAGRKIVPRSLRRTDGTPIEDEGTYVVVMNGFLAGGGDRFGALAEGAAPEVGPGDLDALLSFLRRRPQPVSWAADGRVRRLP